MFFEVLTDDNFVLYAAKQYDNPNCTSVSDFNDDLRIVSYIKRLINKYQRTGTVKIQLLLNHVVTLYNLFGVDFSTKALFLKISTNSYSILKTILVYLSYMPDRVIGVGDQNTTINSSDISIDMNIAAMLRNIK